VTYAILRWVRFAKKHFFAFPVPRKKIFFNAGVSGRKRPIFPSLHPQITAIQPLATKTNRSPNYPPFGGRHAALRRPRQLVRHNDFREGGRSAAAQSDV
jgi:hypothetical protein